MIELSHLDHLVLTVRSIPDSLNFYQQLGMQVETFAGGRYALKFGQQKINLHQAGSEFEPKAGSVQPGSADLCLVTATPLPQVISALQAAAIEIIEGPVERTGACGPINSVYFRDPDSNLIELANYL